MEALLYINQCDVHNQVGEKKLEKWSHRHGQEQLKSIEETCFSFLFSKIKQ